MNNKYEEMINEVKSIDLEISNIKNLEKSKQQDAIITSMKKLASVNKRYIEAVAEDQLDYKATDINEGIKILLHENIEDFSKKEMLVNDLIRQTDALKNVLKIYINSLKMKIDTTN